MKKAISILLLVFIAAGIFAGCQKRIYTEKEREEFISREEASVSEQRAEESKKAENIEVDKANLEKSIGKSEKNKQLFVKFEYGDHMEYHLVKFKGGKAESLTKYLYFDNDGYYNDVKKRGDDGSSKLIESDDSIRCLVYKDKDILPSTYENAYKRYEKQDCTIL
ncbi:MAG: hypothetical protein IJM02_02705 [Clostridia bacterium]|nr:hypothetical protein [Clostridia bacterium]